MRFLLIEDHPVFRDALQTKIASQFPEARFETLQKFENGLGWLRQSPPDFVVLDLELYGELVFEKIVELKAEFPRAPLLIVSMHEDSRKINQALKAGGNGYVTKHDPPEQIEHAIRALLNQEHYLSDRASSILVEKIQEAPQNEFDEIQHKLSKREFEVFQLIGKELTRKQIADRLHISVPTVDTHFERIKTKLELESSYKLLCLAIKSNLNE